MLIGCVGHERDRRSIGAEWRSGERESPRRGCERLPDGIPPAQRVATMVHLVEDDEGAPVFGERAMQSRSRSDLRIGDSHTVKLAAAGAVMVAKGRIETDARAMCSLGPLALEVLGRGHDGDAVDSAPRK